MSCAVIFSFYEEKIIYLLLITEKSECLYSFTGLGVRKKITKTVIEEIIGKHRKRTVIPNQRLQKELNNLRKFEYIGKDPWNIAIFIESYIRNGFIYKNIRYSYVVKM